MATPQELRAVAAEEEDKSSDIIPGSAELSRNVSPAPSEGERGAATRREAEQAKRAAQNEDLNASRAEMNRQKTLDSMKRFSYLLGQTELFQHFVDIKKDRDPEFAQLLEESTQQRKNRGRRGGGDHRRRKT